MTKLFPRRLWLAGAFALTTACSTLLPVAAYATSESPPAVAKSKPLYAGFVRGRLLVRPRVGVDETAMQESLRGLAFRNRMLMRSLNVQVMELPAGVDEVAALAMLRRSGKFAFAELDMAMAPAATVTDPQLGSSWAVPKMGVPSAWNYADGSGVTVAVLDTGVHSAHPDLAANMVPGWNTYDNDANSADIQGHGTLVAGVIGAVANNGLGSAGIAHGAKIMPIRITDAQGYGYFSTMAAGIYWAADHGARVVNISFSGVAGSSSVAAAAQYLRNLGGQVVVSAGNTGGEILYNAYDTLIVAGATDSNDARASFSSFGGFVDIAAPGVSIYTTNKNGGYSSASGTSFSSPVTAAVVALMMSANPALTAAELDMLLFTHARDLGVAGKDVNFGHGRVDAAASVAAASAFNVPDTTAPAVALSGLVAGSTLKGQVNVDVIAADAQGVVGVELYVNGQRHADDIAAPYAFTLDTTRFADGNYTVEARAFDAAGNIGQSAAVALKIVNAVIKAGDLIAPKITRFNVPNGMTLGKTNFSVSSAATDNIKVVAMEVWLDGSRVSRSTRTSVGYSLKVSKLAVGTHQIEVRAFDQAGNVGAMSASVQKLAVASNTSKSGKRLARR